MRQSRDEQLQESAALTCRVEDQKEEVVGVGGATQKELGLWWGLPQRAVATEGPAFQKEVEPQGSFCKDSSQCQEQGGEGVPRCSLPPDLPQVLPNKGSLRNQPLRPRAKQGSQDWILPFLEIT